MLAYFYDQNGKEEKEIERKDRKTTSSDLQTEGTPKSRVASILGHTTEINEKYYTYDTSKSWKKAKDYPSTQNQI